MDQTQLRDLLQRHRQGTLLPQEAVTLLNELQREENVAASQNIIYDLLNQQDTEVIYDDARWEPLLKKVLEIDKTSIRPAVPAHRVRFLKNSWFRYAAILLLIAGSALILYNLSTGPQKGRVQTISVRRGDTVLPGTEQAVLTLADGRKIALNDQSANLLGSEGITNHDGQIRYAMATGISVTNILTTPRGGQYKLQLHDGTNVWLNAASSITYPTKFDGKERKVTISGEAYFEVAKNSTQPFIVGVTGKAEVEVLGTSFNVNAYDNEDMIRTSLLDGSIRTTLYDTDGKRSGTSAVLKPGQQAQMTSNITIVNNIDTDEVIAWKNGRFQFGGQELEEIMRQLSRWYGIDVVYEAHPIDQHFRGGISREANISEVLKMLEATETVHFRMEGKKVYVLK